MPTSCVNLVPIDRRTARLVRRRLRAWSRVCGVYLALWVVAHVAIQIGRASDDRALRSELEQIRTVMEDAEAALAVRQLDFDQAVARLPANLEVGRQPDWSILLALLSASLGERVVLRGVTLERADPDGAAPVRLALSALGESQGAVTSFVLRLEETPPFRSVKLVDTRREPFLAGHAVAFQVECALGAGKEPAP